MTTVRTSVKESVTSKRLDGRGRSVRLVPFLFGVATALDRTDLPGPVLVTMLGDLGLTAAAARALIARMQRDGQLSGVRRGRTVDYRLAGAFAESFHRIRAASTAPAWHGFFHTVLYQVSERHRSFRDLLRRTGQLTGYGLLQQGVLICPTDRRDRLAPALDQAPDDARIYFTQLHMDTANAARAAHTAWNLATLDRTYRMHIRTLNAAVARRTSPPAPDGRTLRRVTDLLSAPLVDTLRGSAVPPELTPPDWSLPHLRTAIQDVSSVFLPPCATYLRRLLSNGPGTV